MIAAANRQDASDTISQVKTEKAIQVLSGPLETLGKKPECSLIVLQPLLGRPRKTIEGCSWAPIEQVALMSSHVRET